MLYGELINALMDAASVELENNRALVRSLNQQDDQFRLTSTGYLYWAGRPSPVGRLFEDIDRANPVTGERYVPQRRGVDGWEDLADQVMSFSAAIDLLWKKRPTDR